MNLHISDGVTFHVPMSTHLADLRRHQMPVTGDLGAPGWWMVRRVVIYGNSGSGKSTLAGRLAAERGLRHVEIDALAFDDARQPVAHAVRNRRVDEAISDGSWVVEGIHRDDLERVLLRADTFIWLDLSRRALAANLVVRHLRLLVSGRARHGRKVTLGSLLRDDLEFIRHSIRKHGSRRQHALRFVERADESGIQVVRANCRRDISQIT